MPSISFGDISARYLTPTPAINAAQVLAVTTSNSADDYVWDVFYRRPTTLSEWNEAANVATLCV